MIKNKALYYTSEKIFNSEINKLRLKNPIYVTDLSKLKNNGDYVVFNFYGEEYIASKSKSKISIFQNRCLHRSYPLKKCKSGNEKLICPYHGWIYNFEGKLIGIPKKNTFKSLPKTKTIKKLYPEICGNFLFASYKKDNLKKNFKKLFKVLEKISNNIDKSVYTNSIKIAANWKLCVENSLDEYHIVKVHPTTAGYHGYMKNFNYFTEGKHSILFSSNKSSDNLNYIKFCKQVLKNKIDLNGYKIFNIFPNFQLIIYLDLMFFTNFEIVSQSKTINNIGVFSLKNKKVTQKYINKFIKYFLTTLVNEDKKIIERYQESLDQNKSYKFNEFFSIFEERIIKFRKDLENG